MNKTVNIVGFQVGSLTMPEAVAWVEKRIAKRTPSHIVTINPEIAWNGLQEKEFGRALKKADLLVPDGSGILWAARELGSPLPERVAGYDLMQEMLRVAAAKKYRTYFLGAAPGVAEKAVIQAVTRYPGLVVSGTHDGYFDEAEEAVMIETIAKAKVDMLFCALGKPRPAELWIQKHLKELNVPVCIGVGGSFNVMAGVDKRAPHWIQSIHLEWLYRALRDPKRMGRLLAIPKFMREVKKQKRAAKQK
ncbi:MAG: WecB/TagA/CpsF family glycosyltransferase [Negativicutes bacterium]|nr:WecB/TagA/CpsF family glycosyltransferase [Negativicutes bacterium]